MTTKTQNNQSLPADIARMSFEEAMAELEKIVKQLEDGKARLDDAIGAYERGSMLKKHCENKLREASAKISLITNDSDGSLKLSPLDS